MAAVVLHCPGDCSDRREAPDSTTSAHQPVPRRSPKGSGAITSGTGPTAPRRARSEYVQPWLALVDSKEAVCFPLSLPPFTTIDRSRILSFTSAIACLIVGKI